MPLTHSCPVRLQALQHGCMDPALSVRKQALISLTALMHRECASEAVAAAFLDAAMPLVMDREDSVRAKCVDLLATTVLDGVMGGTGAALAWRLLALIDQQQELCRYLQRACTQWALVGLLTKPLLTAVAHRACNPAHAQGWTLLAELAARQAGQVKWETVLAFWKALYVLWTERDCEGGWVGCVWPSL